MSEQILRALGLTINESKIYLSLLSLGATSAGKIVQATNIHRKNVYDALQKLVERGLVSYVFEGKVKHFQCKNPQNILRYLEEKKKRIDLQITDVKKQLPSLEKRFNTLVPEIEAQIYRGTEGIKTILKECLHYNEVLFIGATGDVENRLPYFWPQYNKEREQKKSHWKLLLIYEAQHKSITHSKYYSYKVLPKILSGCSVIYIYGDFVANVLWLEKPVAFVVKHHELAYNYKKYFKYLWQQLPRVKVNHQ